MVAVFHLKTTDIFSYFLREYVACNMRKYPLDIMQQTKTQIRVLSVEKLYILGYPKMCPVKILIRLHEYAG